MGAPIPTEVISKKRDGHALSADEISDFIRGFTDSSIPDYQMSALAMAIYLRGMNDEETSLLTRAMLESGSSLQWPDDGRPIVDKHSTGGVGDKTSLILAPLLACCDLRVPMISGRGLGPTGGTLDKLESISGFRTDFSQDEIREITDRVGCIITGATDDIAPADRKLYALRDVTATVASIPLITASIMSKKLAESLDALVLDVKFGSGAFMKTLDEARRLAGAMIAVGNRMNVRTTALLTDMNQPLGRMIGNAVEIDESITTLRGEGPDDLRELVLSLGAELLIAVGIAADYDESTQILRQHIDSGRAMAKFEEMVMAQDGDLGVLRPVSPKSELAAERSGHVAAIDAQQLGKVVVELGGGRRVKTDTIDHSVGLQMLVRIGDEVEAGQPLLNVFAKRDAADIVCDKLSEAITIADSPPSRLPLIVDR
jgi:pyrimidine-nucleoside phosphorylase